MINSKGLKRATAGCAFEILRQNGPAVVVLKVVLGGVVVFLMSMELNPPTDLRRNTLQQPVIAICFGYDQVGQSGWVCCCGKDHLIPCQLGITQAADLSHRRVGRHAVIQAPFPEEQSFGSALQAKFIPNFSKQFISTIAIGDLDFLEPDDAHDP